MAKAFVKDLGAYICAGYPIVTIVSSEGDRALELIDELLRQKEMWKRSRRALLSARATQPGLIASIAHVQPFVSASRNYPKSASKTTAATSQCPDIFPPRR